MTLAPADRWDCAACRRAGLDLIRNCDGDPAREELVQHPKLPMTLRTTECPMRALLDPRAAAYVRLFAFCRRWGVLPRAGGLDDQLARDVEALEVMAAALEAHTPPPAPVPALR